MQIGIIRSVDDEIRTRQTGPAKAKMPKTLLSTLFRSFFRHSYRLLIILIAMNY
jgi:hypothetical protein